MQWGLRPPPGAPAPGTCEARLVEMFSSMYLLCFSISFSLFGEHNKMYKYLAVL